MSNIITISELNKYVANVLAEDDFLQFVIIKGEITGLKKYASGHLYFSIKDATAIIQCVMFAGFVSQLKSLPKDGDEIVAAGRVELFELYGKYQLQVQNIHSVGLGKIEYERELLKSKLEKMGFLERKRQLPSLPHRIAIITSVAGAAVEDIIQTFSRRFPLAILNIYHSQVQGLDAEKSIANAIKRADLSNEIVILARGGGSKEDLSAYDSEVVAMAIWGCSVPVISAVGHETDFSIADLVADIRASTPTAAAEISAPSIIELRGEIQRFELMLNSYSPAGIIQQSEARLMGFIDEFDIIINEKFDSYFLKIDNILTAITNCIERIIIEKDNSIIQNVIIINNTICNITNEIEIELQNFLIKLEAYSPLKILTRGYAIVSKEQKIITNSIDLCQEDRFILQFADGKVFAKVEEVCNEIRG